MKKLDYLCNCKSEISNVCNVLEGHFLEAMKIVHHHASGRFDWLISEYQSVNPSREAISILSKKYKRFTFVHPLTPGKKILHSGWLTDRKFMGTEGKFFNSSQITDLSEGQNL